MTQQTMACLIYATCPSLDEAHRIGRAVVEARLAACVNILPGMTSIYRWKGRVESGQEVVMLLKTTAAHSDAVMAEIKRRHSHEVPAIVVVPIAGGNPDFLRWIGDETADT